MAVVGTSWAIRLISEAATSIPGVATRPSARVGVTSRKVGAEQGLVPAPSVQSERMGRVPGVGHFGVWVKQPAWLSSSPLGGRSRSTLSGDFKIE